MIPRLRLVLTGLIMLGPTAYRPVDAQQSPVTARTRTYYIAADEVDWNYVPGGRDEIAGRPYADSAFFATAKPRQVRSVQLQDAQAATAGMGAPRLPRSSDPRGGGGHDPGGVPE